MRDNGEVIDTAKNWRETRRPEILRLFEEQMYGRQPGTLPGTFGEVRAVNNLALGGKARRKQVTVYFTGDRKGQSMDILGYLPPLAKGPVPAFLGLRTKKRTLTLMALP